MRKYIFWWQVCLQDIFFPKATSPPSPRKKSKMVHRLRVFALPALANGYTRYYFPALANGYNHCCFPALANGYIVFGFSRAFQRLHVVTFPAALAIMTNDQC